MLPIKNMLLTNHNRPHKKIIKLKGIVIHSTANEKPGADAIKNRNYFNSCSRACSVHYIVDEKSIICCIPDSEIAYHVGANVYTKLGQAIIENNFSPNFFLIGIEMCVNQDGDFSKTYKNTIELLSNILISHNFSINSLYRHFDITGKSCPQMLLSSKSWNLFRQDVVNKMKGGRKDA